MLCREHEVIDAYSGLVNDIMSGLFYGVFECDAQEPQGLKDYFAEMAPIFKNSDISYENVSDDTRLILVLLKILLLKIKFYFEKTNFLIKFS